MTDIDSLAARPATYLRETGVPQLTGGLIFFLLGSSVLLKSILPGNFVAQEAPKWVAIAFCCGALWISRKLNQKYVFPRGGYVQMPTPRTRYWVALPAVVAMTVVTLIWRMPRLDSPLLWPAFAILFAGICLSAGYRQRAPVTMWFGVYFVGLAALSWWLPGDNYQRSAYLEVAVGAPMSVYGAFRLRSFVRANAPAEKTHE
jgi:hypothetical protein